MESDGEQGVVNESGAVSYRRSTADHRALLDQLFKLDDRERREIAALLLATSDETDDDVGDQAADGMNDAERAQLEASLARSVEDVRAGRVQPAAEVIGELRIGDLQRAARALRSIRLTLQGEVASPAQSMTDRGLNVLLKKYSEVQALENRLRGFLNEIGYGHYPPFHEWPPGS